MVSTTTKGTAELAWPVLKSSPALPDGISDYQAEVRKISIGLKDQPVQQWIAVPNVKFTKNPTRVTAHLTGIPPGISVTLRILALDPQGKPSAVSFPIHFNVPAPQPFFTMRKCLLAGFGLLLAISLGIKQLQKTSRRH